MGHIPLGASTVLELFTYAPAPAVILDPDILIADLYHALYFPLCTLPAGSPPAPGTKIICPEAMPNIGLFHSVPVPVMIFPLLEIVPVLYHADIMFIL